MRVLTKIIDQMVVVIPRHEWEFQEALAAARQEFVAYYAYYDAPEVASSWWGRIADILEAHIGEPVKDWQREVAAIFNGTGGADET